MELLVKSRKDMGRAMGGKGEGKKIVTTEKKDGNDGKLEANKRVYMLRALTVVREGIRIEG